jgi:hypothetical protein
MLHFDTIRNKNMIKYLLFYLIFTQLTRTSFQFFLILLFCDRQEQVTRVNDKSFRSPFNVAQKFCLIGTILILF